MSTGGLFSSPLETLKLLAKCLLTSIAVVVVVGAAIYLLVHVGQIGLAG